MILCPRFHLVQYGVMQNGNETMLGLSQSIRQNFSDSVFEASSNVTR